MTELSPASYKANPVVSCRIEGEEDAILFNPNGLPEARAWG